MAHSAPSSDSPRGDREQGAPTRRATPATCANAGCSLSGTGSARGHHGELLQGVFTTESGSLRRGLTSLPCHHLLAEAWAELDEGLPGLAVKPSWKTKALRAASATMRAVGACQLGGMLTVRSNIAVGCGLGSSTADVTASIRAVLDALDASLTPEQVAKLAVEAEVAADPLMFDEMLLFAHREGEIIESFLAAGKKISALGVSFAMEPVDTISFPMARYNESEAEWFETLRTRLRQGVGCGDIAEVADVATESARINQRFLPVPSFDRLLRCISSQGADGIQIAHSGNVGAFLFDSADPNLFDRVERTKWELRRIGFAKSWFYEEQL